nr:hypothetical protein [Tanacetum cinerariifolium]
MPPKVMSQATIERLITQRVNAALEAERVGGQDRAPPVRECTFSSFMKCNPTPFHGKERDIELCRWFEKFEMVFSISDCAERNKVKFVVATLQGRALTWWNSQVATLGLNVAIGKSWGDMKKMMLEEFYPDEEVQRMEDELRSLKLRDTNIAAYTYRFHELVLLCPEAVPTKKKKVEAYIKVFRKIARPSAVVASCPAIAVVMFLVIVTKRPKLYTKVKSDFGQPSSGSPFRPPFSNRIELVDHPIAPKVVNDGFYGIQMKLIPKTIHTTPPNKDYVAPATISILDDLLEEFGDEILNVTMVDEGTECGPTKDLEELKRLLTKDPQSHYTKI